jgi:hypothetical protein
VKVRCQAIKSKNKDQGTNVRIGGANSSVIVGGERGSKTKAED